MRKNEQIFFRIDWPLLVGILLLMMLGILTVYSVAYTPKAPSIFDFSQKYGKQLFWVSISLFLGFIILLIDSSIYRKYAEFIYISTLLLLVLVLFMPPVNGARAWLGIGSLGIQPAEFAKVSTALLLAKWVDMTNVKLQGPRTVVEYLSIIFIPSLFIILQPDAGTLLVFTSFFFVMYREGITFDPVILYVLRLFPNLKFKSTWLGTHFIPFLFFLLIISVISLYLSNVSVDVFGFLLSGTTTLSLFVTLLGLLILGVIFLLGYRRQRTKHLVILIGSYLFTLFVILSVTFVFNHVAKPHQKNRIELVLGLKEDPNGTDYNRNRAMAAVGSGGGLGKGYKMASISSVRNNHVPESETDFIFCPFAEEWGFLGAFVLLSTYIFVLFRIFIIAERQRGPFFRAYAYAVGIILFYHFAINIGMNIGLSPVIGIHLPFMSYGGSSMMAFSIMVFILLKLDSQRYDFLR